MDKQQQNIQRVVAHKALKVIHTIVEDDKIKEKNEKKGAMLVSALILFFAVFIMTLVIFLNYF